MPDLEICDLGHICRDGEAYPKTGSRNPCHNRCELFENVQFVVMEFKMVGLSVNRVMGLIDGSFSCREDGQIISYIVNELNNGVLRCCVL